MSLVYGVIYLTFSMYPLAFVVERHFSQVDGSLPFISIFIGVVVACVALAVHSIYYLGPMAKQTKIHVPERRLPPMIAGSFILPAGESILFFFFLSFLAFMPLQFQSHTLVHTLNSKHRHLLVCMDLEPFPALAAPGLLGHIDRLRIHPRLHVRRGVPN